GAGSEALVSGVASAESAPNLRGKSCPNGGPPVEDADLSEPNSPFLARKPAEIINPLRVSVGKPDGLVPVAAQAFFGAQKTKEKPVPVPTPRPDYAPQGNAEMRGTLPTKQP
ncbi:MAG: hypothetical protein ACRCT6_10215, partial [Notoacmeibacter sp.]